MDVTRQKYLAAIADAADVAALEDLRVAAVGKKGEISLKMRELGRMSPEERATAGPALNALKDEIISALAAKKAALGDAALDERLKGEWLDVTLPARPRGVGTIHPVSQVTDEITAIFADMGFAVAEGPQVESDWYNFDALNIPPEHPTRTEMDTFYLAREPGDDRPPHVLRTHTSPVQIRAMQDQGAPIRVIAPRRVYRAAARSVFLEAAGKLPSPVDQRPQVRHAPVNHRSDHDGVIAVLRDERAPADQRGQAGGDQQQSMRTGNVFALRELVVDLGGEEPRNGGLVLIEEIDGEVLALGHSSVTSG